MLAIKFIFLFFLLAMPLIALAIVCPPGTYLVSGHQRSEYFRNDGTHVDAATVSSYCKNYRTDGPFKTVFADKMPKGWPHKKEEFRGCTAKEKNNITEILKSIPVVLTQVGEVTILCAKKSQYKNNPATSAPSNKIIVLYNSAMGQNLKRILIHELAHIIYANLSTKERDSYWQSSGWNTQNPSKEPTISRKLFSAPDEAFSPEEDFANNVEYSLIEPTSFKKQFGDIDAWITNFLGDQK